MTRRRNRTFQAAMRTDDRGGGAAQLVESIVRSVTEDRGGGAQVEDRALAMIVNGQICDGNTIMLLYWAAVHGPFAGVRRPAIRGA
jgi:hypothetical protein